MSITLSIKLIRFRSVDMECIELHPIANIQNPAVEGHSTGQWNTTKELGTRLFAITRLEGHGGRMSGNEAKKRTEWMVGVNHWLKLRPWRIVAWTRPHIWHEGMLLQYLAVCPFSRQWKQSSRFDKMSTLESTETSIRMGHWDVAWGWPQIPQSPSGRCWSQKVESLSGGAWYLLIIAHRSTNSTKLWKL